MLPYQLHVVTHFPDVVRRMAGEGRVVAHEGGVFDVDTLLPVDDAVLASEVARWEEEREGWVVVEEDVSPRRT